MRYEGRNLYFHNPWRGGSVREDSDDVHKKKVWVSKGILVEDWPFEWLFIYK